MSENAAPTTVGPNNFPIPADIREIKKWLPHRYPFLLVDRVVSVDPGKHIHAYKNVTGNEPFFDGHFPEFPVMPGVLQLEALAQAGALLVVASMEADSGSQKLPFLMSMEKVKFRRPVVPGDRLDLEAEIILLKSRVGKIKATASVDGKKAAEAIISAGIQSLDAL
jgi:3-hydroxyacyl-[acyl-carrier-protein] dehydratase